MNVEDIQNLLAAISRTLATIRDFPVFEEVIEDGSYYTMSDLTIGDAVQALNEVVQGIENVNAPDQFSDLYLTPDLEEAIIFLSELGIAIARTDKANHSRKDDISELSKNDKLTEKTEEMLTVWDIDKKYKYLCFYHKAFPFMNDSWGMDCSDSKEELLENHYPLFSPRDISEQSTFDETFRLVLNAIASDPQILLCSDGEYRICRYAGSGWNWVGVPTRFNKLLWKALSSQYRAARNGKYPMHRAHMIALDDTQFEMAQRLIREVFGGEIDTHEIKDEF